MACPGDDKMSAASIAEPVILRAEHLGRSTNGKILVEDANFELKKGELLAVVGPSGSGKTSLLRLLNRLDEPTSGTVFVEGLDYQQPRAARTAPQAWYGHTAPISFPHGGRESRFRSRPAW